MNKCKLDWNNLQKILKQNFQMMKRSDLKTNIKNYFLKQYNDFSFLHPLKYPYLTFWYIQQKLSYHSPFQCFSPKNTVKQGNFDWRGNFDRSGSFVKVATVPIRKCLFVASAFMEINDWCLGLRIYMYLRPCLHRSNLKTSCKLGISRKNWTFFKTVLAYWVVPDW